jgi:hypothetical protein
MPTATYTPLATVTLASSASSVTFSNIPATYRDLILVCDNVRVNSGGENIHLNLNGDTSSSNYSIVTMSGSGSSTNSFSGNSLIIGYNAYPTNTSAANLILQFMDYSATDKHKTVLMRGNNASIGTQAQATRWANTLAVTSVAIKAESTSFQSATTFNLYGISA